MPNNDTSIQVNVVVSGLLSRIAAYYGIPKKDLVHGVLLGGMMPLLEEIAANPDAGRLRDAALALMREAVGEDDSGNGEGPN